MLTTNPSIVLEYYENLPVHVIFYKSTAKTAKTSLKPVKTGYFGCEAEFAEV